MTTTLTLITLLATTTALGAHIGRTAVQLTLAYLALRHTKPSQRTEILHALGTALATTNTTSQRRSTDRQPAAHNLKNPRADPTHHPGQRQTSPHDTTDDRPDHAPAQ